YQGKIGLDAFMLCGEQPAGTTEPGLNLVENQNDVVARTNFPHRFEIAGGWNDHSRLALDGLDQEGDCVGRNRRFERGSVAKGHNAAEAGGKWAEAVARGRIGPEADHPPSAALTTV